MTDREITAQFENAGDFIRRELCCCGYTLYVYAIDGLISGADASEYIVKPLMENMQGDSILELFRNALHSSI